MAMVDRLIRPVFSPSIVAMGASRRGGARAADREAFTPEIFDPIDFAAQHRHGPEGVNDTNYQDSDDDAIQYGIGREGFAQAREKQTNRRENQNQKDYHPVQVSGTAGLRAVLPLDFHRVLIIAAMRRTRRRRGASYPGNVTSVHAFYLFTAECTRSCTGVGPRLRPSNHHINPVGVLALALIAKRMDIDAGAADSLAHQIFANGKRAKQGSSASLARRVRFRAGVTI